MRRAYAATAVGRGDACLAVEDDYRQRVALGAYNTCVILGERKRKCDVSVGIDLNAGASLGAFKSSEKKSEGERDYKKDRQSVTKLKFCCNQIITALPIDVDKYFVPCLVRENGFESFVSDHIFDLIISHRSAKINTPRRDLPSFGVQLSMK